VVRNTASTIAATVPVTVIGTDPTTVPQNRPETVPAQTPWWNDASERAVWSR
jgi:hypothetical protein